MTLSEKIKFLAKTNYFAILYYLTIGKLLWLTSTYMRHKRSGHVIKCPICGGGKAEYCFSVAFNSNFEFFDNRDIARKLYGLSFLKKYSYFIGWPKGFEVGYYRCEGCGSIFQNAPMYGDAKILYYSRYYKHNAQTLRNRQRNYHAGSKYHLWAEYIVKVASLPPGGRVLDIGCAEGFLVRRLNEMGY